MTHYEIRVNGKTAPNWADWFGEMQVRAIGEDGQKLHDLILTGNLTDQSALLGVLMSMHNLNLTILTVRKEEEVNDDRQQVA